MAGLGSSGSGQQEPLQQDSSSTSSSRLQTQVDNEWGKGKVRPSQAASRSHGKLGLSGVHVSRERDLLDEPSTSSMQHSWPGQQLQAGIALVEDGGLQGRRGAHRVGGGSPLGGGTAAAAGLHRDGPWDLRSANGQAMLKQFQQGSAGGLVRGAGLQHPSQGLTPLLNAPNSAASQMGTLGAIWCWPFAAGPDLSLIVPPADPSLLPPVSMAHFEPYLRSTGNAQIRFEEARRRAAEDAVRPSPIAAAVGELGDGATSSRVAPGEGLVEALRSVPPMFFQEDFSLARPETWREVLGSEDERPDERRAARLEEYSGYLDIVETQLLKEIAARRENLFEAGAVVQDLRASLHRTFSSVTSLRRGVGTLCVEIGEAAHTVTSIKRRRANLEAVLEKLKVVEEVAAAQEAVELLLPQGDFAGALDVLDSLRGTLMTHHTSGLHAFRHLPAQLADIAEAVDDLLSSETLRIAQFHEQAAVVARIASSLSAESSGRDHSARQTSSSADAESDSLNFQEELTPLILGLRRTGHLSATIKLMRVASAEELKSGVRDLVDQCLSQLLGNRLAGSPLADKLQGLRPAQFLQLLDCVAEMTAASLDHVREVHNAVEGLLKGSKAGRNLAATVANDFGEVVQAVSEAAHSAWIRLLASRSTAVSSLTLEELQQLIETSGRFASTVQGYGTRPILALRNAVQVQSKAFLETMHHRALARLTHSLEQEVWISVQVPGSCQAIVDGVFRRAAGAGPDHAHPTGSSQLQGDGAPADSFSDKLQVGEHGFHAVESLLILLEQLDQYLAFLDSVSGLATENAHRVVELIKVFNSRTCQLVLGAGAMQVAGLKSITAKHLALSCQCLGALIALHAPLLAALGAPLPVSRRALLVPELRLVLQDLTVHRGEVHSKLVGIMRERLIVGLKQLPNIAVRWAAHSPGSQPQPSAFSQNMVKQLRILAQVLSPLLLEEELHSVFGRVGVLFSKSLTEAFSRLEPLGPAWEAQVRTDLHFLLAALRELPMAPASREANLERLAQLCRTRFAPLADVTPRSTSSSSAADERLRAAAGSVRSPVAAERQTLVSRLGAAKLPPLFRRDIPNAEAGISTAEEAAGPHIQANGGTLLYQQQPGRQIAAEAGFDKLENGVEAAGQPAPEGKLQAAARAGTDDDALPLDGVLDGGDSQADIAGSLSLADDLDAGSQMRRPAEEEDELSMGPVAAENASREADAMGLQALEDEASRDAGAASVDHRLSSADVGGAAHEEVAAIADVSLLNDTAGGLAEALLQRINLAHDLGEQVGSVSVVPDPDEPEKLSAAADIAADLDASHPIESEAASLVHESLPVSSLSSAGMSGLQHDTYDTAAEALPEPGSQHPVLPSLPSLGAADSSMVLRHLEEPPASNASASSLRQKKDLEEQLQMSGAAQAGSQHRALAISEMLKNMEAEALEWQIPAAEGKE